MKKYLKEFNRKYYVTSDGNVFNDETGHKLKPMKNKSGDLFVWLSIERCTYLRYVKRLVAESFVENPENFKYVSHKDFNKENNNAENLIWVPHYRQKKVLCIESNAVYNSIKEAAKNEFINNVHLAMCIRERKSACGKHFKII